MSLSGTAKDRHSDQSDSLVYDSGINRTDYDDWIALGLERAARYMHTIYMKTRICHLLYSVLHKAGKQMCHLCFMVTLPTTLLFLLICPDVAHVVVRYYTTSTLMYVYAATVIEYCMQGEGSAVSLVVYFLDRQLLLGMDFQQVQYTH